VVLHVKKNIPIGVLGAVKLSGARSELEEDTAFQFPILFMCFFAVPKQRRPQFIGRVTMAAKETLLMLTQP
jgi:hypothetical protein